MNEARAREEICRVGRSLFERGYAHATAGNISVRLDEGLLITPTDACLGFLDPARLARVDRAGLQVDGDPASKTVTLHRRIYEAACIADPGTRCVIHTHSTHCVALTLGPHRDELLAPITPYFVIKVGHVPVLAYHPPGDAAAATQTARLIERFASRGTPIRAVMLARLGPNVWHDSPGQAMAVLEELEETARLTLLSQPAPSALGEADIDVLRRRFSARW